MMCKMASVCLQFTIHYTAVCPVFQGRMGRKGFPGKVGPEGVKVDTNSTCIFSPSLEIKD